MVYTVQQLCIVGSTRGFVAADLPVPFKGRKPLGLLLNACFGELLSGDDELPVCKALSGGAHENVRHGLQMQFLCCARPPGAAVCCVMCRRSWRMF